MKKYVFLPLLLLAAEIQAQTFSYYEDFTKLSHNAKTGASGLGIRYYSGVHNNANEGLYYRGYSIINPNNRLKRYSIFSTYPKADYQKIQDAFVDMDFSCDIGIDKVQYQTGSRTKGYWGIVLSARTSEGNTISFAFLINKKKYMVVCAGSESYIDIKTSKQILPGKKSDIIHRNDINTLRITKTGAEWNFYINNTNVGKTRDESHLYACENFLGAAISEVQGGVLITKYSMKLHAIASPEPFDEFEFRKKLESKYKSTFFSFSEGLMTVVNKTNDNWGAVDSTGNEVIPAIYKKLGSFGNGLAPAELNGQKGYINKNGNFILLFNDYAVTKSFSQGFAAVKKDDNSNYALIDITGKLSTKFIYSDFGGFDNGKARVVKEGKEQFLDLRLQVIDAVSAKTGVALTLKEGDGSNPELSFRVPDAYTMEQKGNEYIFTDKTSDQRRITFQTLHSNDRIEDIKTFMEQQLKKYGKKYSSLNVNDLKSNGFMKRSKQKAYEQTISCKDNSKKTIKFIFVPTTNAEGVQHIAIFRFEYPDQTPSNVIIENDIAFIRESYDSILQ